jgi:DNA-binding phage protein
MSKKKVSVVKFVPPVQQLENSRVWLVNRFNDPTAYKQFEKELKASGNASEVARKYQLNPQSVGQLARRLGIQLRKPGRPAVYKYDERKLLPKLQKAVAIRGGVAELARATGLPYQTLDKLAHRRGLK